MQRNAAALVDGPKVRKVEIRPFTSEEIAKLIAQLESERLGPLYFTALSLGLRQGEVLGLSWKDLDLDKNTIKVSKSLQRVDRVLTLVEPKTEKSRRTLAIPDTLAKMLKRRRSTQFEDRLAAGAEWYDSGLVFTTQQGKPLDGLNVTRNFKRVLKKADVPQRRFHDLRHTAASVLVSRKVHPRAVMEMLGHAEIRTTMDIYSHISTEVRQDTADQMDAVLMTAGAAV